MEILLLSAGASQDHGSSGDEVWAGNIFQQFQVISPVLVVWIGLDWFGLFWIGLDWFGLFWIGLDWFGLVRIGFDWFGLVRFEPHQLLLKRNGEGISERPSHQPKPPILGVR